MRTAFYLYVNSQGHVRTTKRPGGINSDEVMFPVELDVPVEYFERAVPPIELRIPALGPLPEPVVVVGDPPGSVGGASISVGPSGKPIWSTKLPRGGGSDDGTG